MPAFCLGIQYGPIHSVDRSRLSTSVVRTLSGWVSETVRSVSTIEVKTCSNLSTIIFNNILLSIPIRLIGLYEEHSYGFLFFTISVMLALYIESGNLES